MFCSYDDAPILGNLKNFLPLYRMIDDEFIAVCRVNVAAEIWKEFLVD